MDSTQAPHFPNILPFDYFRDFGATMIRLSHAWLADEERAVHTALQMLPSIERDTLGDSQSAIRALIFSGKWAMSGYPTVDLGAKLAGSLMATSFPTEQADDLLRMPWPAFAIRIPEKLIVGESGGSFSLVRAHTSSFRSGVEFVVSGHEGAVALYQSGRSMADLWANEGTLGEGDPFGIPIDTRDRRTIRMLLNLFAGVCLELSDPRALDESRRGRTRGGRAKHAARLPGELPDYERFELRRAVRLDVRETVRAFIDHGAKHPTVQTLVRGHWKMQAHGPARTLRKALHIEPYWRGRVDDPVSDRSGG